MWVIFGILAIAVTLINLYLFKAGKDYRLALAAALSLTALTLTAEYSLVSTWVEAEDWSALMDVVPGMESALWLLTIASILLNMIPILFERKQQR